MKALITGATGFIGKELVQYLIDRGIEIRLLVRNKVTAYPDNIEQHIGDLALPETLIDAANHIDIVFHLGGYAHAWNENLDKDMHQQINLQGTKNIFTECIRSKVKKFIFFSTIKAVGDAQHCINEQWQTMPNTPYGMAKRNAEEMILEAGRNCGIHICILRLALVYGYSLKGNLYNMLRAIDKNYFLPIPPVKNHRSYVSTHDVCQAAWLAATHDIANKKIYYVTDKKSYSTYQLYVLMRDALGKTIPRWYIPQWIFKLLALSGDYGGYIFRRRLPFNSQTFEKLFGSSHCSAQLIEQELNFQPKYSIVQMLPDIVKHYQENKL